MVTLVQTYSWMSAPARECPSDSIYYGMCEHTGCPFGGTVTAAPPTNVEKAETQVFVN